MKESSEPIFHLKTLNNNFKDNKYGKKTQQKKIKIADKACFDSYLSFAVCSFLVA